MKGPGFSALVLEHDSNSPRSGLGQIVPASLVPAPDWVLLLLVRTNGLRSDMDAVPKVAGMAMAESMKEIMKVYERLTVFR